MASRVSPTERVRAEIDVLFSSDQDLASVLEQVGRLTVRLLMQQAIEAEVEVFLGRKPHERRGEDAPAGSRNGWQPPATVKTTMGPIELQRPKLRGTDERFCSQLFGLGVTRTNALEALVISAWVRGLSDRDIEGALREVLGDEAALSKSTVSRICQQVKDDFAAFAERQETKKSTRVMVNAVHLEESDGMIRLRVIASHFLWKMVRRMAGVLVAVGRGKLDAAQVQSLLQASSALPAPLTAPAMGLFFERAFYEDADFQDFLARLLDQPAGRGFGAKGGRGASRVQRTP